MIDIYDKLEIELDSALHNIALYRSVDIMKDERLLVIRVNNSGESEGYVDDYIRVANEVKDVVTGLLPEYSPWLEFDYGLPREFITFIFVSKGE